MIRLLCAGETRAKSVALGGVGELCVRHFLDVVAQNDELRQQSDFLADLAGNEVVVTGDDLDRDGVVLERPDGRGGALLRRIEKRHVTVENEVALVGFAVGGSVASHSPSRFDGFGGDGEDPKAVGAELLVFLLQALDVPVIHGDTFAIELEAHTPGEDRLGSALGDDAVLAVGGADDDRHDAAGEIEGDLVDLGLLGDASVLVSFLVREHRPIQDVLEARLKVAVGIGERQHVLALAQQNVAVAFENDLVHRQGTRLVGAKNVHRAEVLDGVDAFDDDLLLAHRDRPFGQTHRHDHGQHFWRQTDGHGHREEERLSPIAFREPIDDEDQGHHHGHETQNEPREPGDAAIESRLGRSLRERLGHAAEVGILAGRDQHGDG
jgi:hypothetical protein